MAQANVDVLDLPAKGRVSLTEKQGKVTVRAKDPVSALQAIARHSQIKIHLSRAEAERFDSVGQLDIALSYTNDAAGAAEAAQNIERLVTEALASMAVNSRPSLRRLLAWLILAILLGAVGFAAGVAILDATHGFDALSRWFQQGG